MLFVAALTALGERSGTAAVDMTLSSVRLLAASHKQRNIALLRQSLNQASLATATKFADASGHDSNQKLASPPPLFLDGMNYSCPNSSELKAITSFLFDALSGYSLPTPNSSCCSWQGITCTAGNITEINLNGFGLAGTLPSTLNLPSLQMLYMSSNELLGGTLPGWTAGLESIGLLDFSSTSVAGTLPPEWAGLEFLQYVDVSDSLVSGTLPEAWQVLSLLTEVCIDGSKIEGTLPPAWANLQSLQLLTAPGTAISGQLPAEWARMTQLQGIDISSTSIEGTLPEEWGQLQQLQQLIADNTMISGDLPRAWANMSSLWNLHVTGCRLSGTLPSEWGALQQLQLLFLFDTDLSGTLPNEWGSLIKMQALDLHGTQLNGTLPSSFGNWSVAWHIDLSNTSIVGSLPAEWSGMSSVQSICVSDTNLGGSIPAQWGASLSQLKLFDVHATSVSGTLPQEWGGGAMRSLEYIYLSGTNISGTLPTNWYAMPSLQQLDLSDSQVFGTLPEAWWQLRQMTTLTLSSTRLSGSLPEAWANMSTLSTLDVSNTMLSGSLPSEYSALRSLQGLSLSRTAVSGTLPAEWASMPSLEYLHLGETLIGGTLPPQWGHMPRLLFLDIHQANLSGTLPPEWAFCNNMGSLILHQNQLVGGIPVEWVSGMAILGLLVLSENNLTEMPQALPPNLPTVALSGNKLSGTVPCYATESLGQLYLDRNPGLEGISVNCIYKSLWKLTLTATNVSSLPSNLSLILPKLRYFVARRLPNLRTIPQFADTFGITLDFHDNSLILSALNQSLSAARFLDFSPIDDLYASPVNFNSMCSGNCTPMGPFTGGNFLSYLPPHDDALCARSMQQIFVDYPAAAFSAGDFSSGASVSVLRTFTNNADLFFDFLSPVYVTAVLSTNLNVADGFDLPPYASAAVTPTWSPISFGPFTQTVLFNGMVSSQLLFGVPYTLDFTLSLNGVISHQLFPDICPLPPFVYTYTIQNIRPRPCSPGLLEGNFTQSCFACPYNGRCSGAHIFAAVGTSVWRPSADSLPFAPCLGSGKGCVAGPEVTDRVGYECAVGYGGPMCAACSDGYGKSGSSSCAECLPAPVNMAATVVAVALSLGVVTFTAISSSDPHQKPSSAGWSAAAMSAVRLVTNHLSLLGILAHTEAASAVSETLRQALVTQSSASSPSPIENSFMSCLFPSLTVNTQLLIVAASVPALISVEVLLVKARFGKWAVFAVAAAVLQLTYMQTIQTASRLLRHVQLNFFESTPYLVDRSTAPVTLALDLLQADARINFQQNTHFWLLAWLILAGVGVGTPIWFVMAFKRTQRRHSTFAAHQKFRFLVHNYRPACWYWETVVTLRKGLAVILVAALAEFPTTQMQCVCLLYTIYTFAHEKMQPFSSQSKTVSERVSLACAILTGNAILITYDVQQHTDSTFTTGNVFLAVFLIIAQIAALAVIVRVIILDVQHAKHRRGKVDGGVQEESLLEREVVELDGEELSRVKIDALSMDSTRRSTSTTELVEARN